MLIAIPSKARATRQITLGQLPKSVYEHTFLFVSDSDKPSYEYINFPVIGIPDSTPGIGWARQHILGFAKGMKEDKVLMLDDDLTFAIRRKDDPTRFIAPEDQDLERMFKVIEMMLDDYAHVAVSPREGGNRRIEPYIDNTRALRALAFRRDILEREQIRFTDMEVMEDFYVQLSLLTRGFRHRSLNWMVQNQAGSNAAGGCSTYRTMEVQDRAAKALAAKFPDFVKVVQKETKVAWGGKPRTDVIVFWKAAFASAPVEFSLGNMVHEQN